MVTDEKSLGENDVLVLKRKPTSTTNKHEITFCNETRVRLDAVDRQILANVESRNESTSCRTLRSLFLISIVEAVLSDEVTVTPTYWQCW